jgi:hypothetical protein
MRRTHLQHQVNQGQSGLFGPVRLENRQREFRRGIAGRGRFRRARNLLGQRGEALGDEEVGEARMTLDVVRGVRGGQKRSKEGLKGRRGVVEVCVRCGRRKRRNGSALRASPAFTGTRLCSRGVQGAFVLSATRHTCVGLHRP